MPLFAYVCKNCGAHSELLARVKKEVSCPTCGSQDMERQLSRFAAVTGQSKEPAACTGCAMAGGGCSSGHEACCML